MPTTDRVITLQIKSDGSGFIKDVDASRAAVVKFGKESSTTGTKARAAGKSIERMGDDSRVAAAGVGVLRSAFVALGGVIGAREIINAGLSMDAITSQLKAASGSALGAASDFEFLRSESLRLGLDLETTAEGFAKFAASVRNTSLEGQGMRDVFSAVSEASVVLKLQADQTGGVFKALEQIMSKGKVQAEELRGQLGERLPGAFRLAAEGMGVATEKLDEMLNKGEIVAEDFLPRFAAAVKKAYGKDAVEAADSARSAFNRFGNALFELSATVASSGLVDAIGELADRAAGFLRFLDVLATSDETTRKLKSLGNAVEDLDARLERAKNRLQLLQDTFADTKKIDRQKEAIASLTLNLSSMRGELKFTQDELRLMADEAGGAHGSLTGGGDGGGGGGLAGAAKTTTSELAKLEAKLADLVALRTLQGSEGILGGDFFTRGIIPTQEELDRFAEFVTILPKAAGSVEKLKASMDSETAKAVDDVRGSWDELIFALESTSIIFDRMDIDFGRVAESMIANAGLISRSIKDIQGGTAAGRIQGAGGLAVAAGGALGGTAGRVLGGVGGGAIAGAAIGAPFGGIGAPIGAVIGGIIGGLAGLFGGGGGDKPKEPRVFFSQGGPGVGLRGGVDRDTAFGSFGIGARHVGDPSAFRESARQTAAIISGVESGLSRILTGEEQAAATSAIGVGRTRQVGEDIDLESQIVNRWTTILGAMDEQLGEMFGENAEGLPVGEAGELALAMADVFDTVREGTFAIRDMSDPMQVLSFLFDDLRDDGQSLAEALVQMQVGMELLRRLDLASFTQDAALLADGMIDALGGLDQAVAAVADFRARFFSETEIMQQDIDAAGENLGVAFGEIGLAMADFSGEGGIEGFRAAFDSVKDGLSPADLALWIEAGVALGVFTDATSALADAAQAVQDSIDAILGGSATSLAGLEMTPLERQIARVNTATEQAIAALLDLEASEEDLAQVRADGAAAIDILTEAENERLAAIQHAADVAAAEQNVEAIRNEINLLNEELAVRGELATEIERMLDVQAAWALATETGMQTLDRTADAVRAASLAYDGTVGGLRSLSAAAGDFQAAALAALQSIMAARASIDSALGSSIESLTVGGLTPAEQYEFFTSGAEDLAASLVGMADPAEIAATVAEITRLTNLAFGVADPEQQDQIRKDFIGFLEGVGDVASGLLDGIQGDVTDTTNDLADTVAPAMMASADRMADVADSLASLGVQFKEAIGVLNELVSRGPAVVYVPSPFDKDTQLAA